MRAADTISGVDVVDATGREIGTVADILIDVDLGRVALAIVARHANAKGPRLVPVPWGALSEDAARGCFVLDIAAERLDGAPGFDEAPWPSMDEESWQVAMMKFYGSPATRG
jgi:hypothetical protein